MKVEIFPRAETDIIGQFRYYLVEKDTPATAALYREAVKESIEQLRLYPRIGSLVHGSLPGLRSWPVKGFEFIRVYYLLTSDTLRVVRVLHSKRNVDHILRREKFT